MQKLWKILAVFAVMFMLPSTAAMAQATRTWVSGVGDDANPCSRTAPCRTFAGTISKTATGGEINVLDPGGFGALTITKSITVRSDNIEGGVLVAGQNGFVINIPGGAGRVAIVGLDFEGLNQSPTTPGINGVRIIDAFDVLIQDTTIHGFDVGVQVEAATTSRVTIRNSTLHSNLKAVNNIATPGAGKVKVVDSLLLDNSQGLVVDGAGNDIEITNNRIIGPQGLVQLNGGIVRSFGGNMIPSAATPAETVATE